MPDAIVLTSQQPGDPRRAPRSSAPTQNGGTGPDVVYPPGHRTLADRIARCGALLTEFPPGIGPRRKKALLQHFGSARAVSRASLEDLAAVDGISSTVARKIHDHFRGDG